MKVTYTIEIEASSVDDAHHKLIVHLCRFLEDLRARIEREREECISRFMKTE